MNDSNDAADAIDAQQRTASRRLLLGVLMGAFAVCALAAGAFVLFRPGPCAQVADRWCALLTPEECKASRAAFTRIPIERCIAANKSLDEVEGAPVKVQVAARAKVMSELIGAPDKARMLSDAVRALIAPIESLDREGSFTDGDRRAVLAAPPAACLVLLGKMATGQAHAQGPIHSVLVEMNGGTDLGATADSWTAWCRARAGLQ